MRKPGETPDPPDPQRLLEIATEVVAAAAGTAAAMREQGVAAVATKSTATDVVTAADRAVERQVVAAIRAVRPTDAILGEEYGAEGADGRAGASAVRWILDPIDGTVNYLYGLPHYAVSLAAEIDGEVVVGVVRDVVTGDVWSAVRGRGAYRADRRLTGSNERELSRALVATGFGYDAARRAHQGAVLARLIPHVRDIRRLGSAALDLCLAAEGVVDAYYEKGLAPWDHAAAGLIAAEAGLRVAGLAGAPPGEALVIAAPPALFGPLHARLAEFDAAGGP
jgi:myo-inositol-1(or 4)-monophosphatase